MNILLLDKKINELKGYFLTLDGISEQGMEGFRERLASLDGWDTFRINPVDFAGKAGLGLSETLKLFVYGTKVGIFSFEWNLLCPYCGGREHSHDSLDQLEKESYRCTICDADVEVIADNHMEVSFTVRPEISEFNPDPHRSFDDYWRYFFSEHFVRPAEFARILASQPKMRFAVIDSGKKVLAKINDTPAKKHRVVTLDSHSVYTAYYSKDVCADTRKLSIDHQKNGFSKTADTIECGPAEIEIRNSADRRIGVIVAAPDSPAIYDAVQKYPPYFRAFVTGKMMLNNQPFRELFLVDNLPNDLSLRVNDITLMFTDLKSSTAMYSRIGDVKAYRIVQKHFEILQQTVQKNKGAVVKTMGDAIMASFCTATDAVSAAADMLDEIRAYNASMGGEEQGIGLKIGIHRGPVIAVKANQTLDYFGQTVNIAARVQSLAESGDVYLSHDVITIEGVSDILRKRNYCVSEKSASLKGIDDAMKVHRCCAE